ncbi:MAG: stage II sporulation protein M [Lachnospiraceae bacterium]|nr:stage II sporulation protein M [Lachnospiraceae bacterium]
MNYSKSSYYTYRKWILIFTAGFMAGIMLINFRSNIFIGESGIFNASSLNRLTYLKIDNGTFFRYVTGERLRDYLVLVLLSTTYFGIIASYGAALWQGMMLGMVVTVAVIRFGISGLLLVMTSFFPHQLILLPAGIMMVMWCYRNCSVLYFGGRNTWIRETKKRFLIRQMMMLLWILVVVIIGCILESYVNPILLEDVVKFF